MSIKDIHEKWGNQKKKSKNKNDERDNSDKDYGIGSVIDVDILERIRREAKHKKISPKILVNKILRDSIFKTKKMRKEERLETKTVTICPECGFNLKKNQKDSSFKKSKTSKFSLFSFFKRS